MHTETPASCPLCQPQDETLIWRDEQLRVIAVDDPAYPGFTRVIWNAHAAEMTDLPPAARAHLMQAVWTVEQALRDTLQPHKINLASLGNMVPHLHWHVIPRWQDDLHFPDPVWAAPKHDPARHVIWHDGRLKAIQARLPECHAHMRSALALR